MGGALGLWLGVVALELLARWAPAEQMHLTDVRLDALVLAFTAVVSLAAAVAFGTIPAWRASRVQPQDVLRAFGRGASATGSRLRLLQGSVVVQVALAVLLLLGSGLMLRTLSALFATNPGFRAENVITAQVSIPGATYDTPERALGFFEALLERVRTQPGIEDAALVLGLPFTDQTDSSPFDIPSRPRQQGEPERHHEARIISDGYFRTLGIPLLRGRDFDGREKANDPTLAVIDQTFAEQFFPGEDPVGKEIIGYTGSPVTIIGVAARVDRTELASAPKASAYYSYRQLPWGGWRSIAVRSAEPVPAVSAMLRSALAEIDRNVPLYDVQTMSARIESSLGPRRLALLAFGAFAALSLLLATLGVYGVMRHLTTQRTREIGIRIAVGAAPREVVGMIVRQGAAISIAGLALGVLAAFWLTGLMAGLLFGVGPRDPVAFAGAVAVLGTVAIFSSWLPARTAARVQPVIALRSE
jgi:putative ABC transport system permease protein